LGIEHSVFATVGVRYFAKAKDTKPKPAQKEPQKGGQKGPPKGKEPQIPQKQIPTAKQQPTSTKSSSQKAASKEEQVNEVSETPIDYSSSIGTFIPILPRHTSSVILKDNAIPTQLREQFMLLGQNSLLLRKSTLPILNSLSQSNIPEHNFWIDGIQGSGKTATLLQALHYCVKSDWFVFYVPSVRNFSLGKSTIFKQQGTQSFSQPEAGLVQFDQLKIMNPKWFEKLKLQKDHRLGETFTSAGRKLVSVNKGITFASVAEIAAANFQQSSQALVVLLEELALQKEVSVLLVVDDANYLFGSTQYDDPDDTHPLKKKKLHASRLLFLEKLSKFVTNETKFERGATVSAVTRTIDNSSSQEGILSYEDLLANRGKKDKNDHLNQINLLNIPNFDREELQTALQHYRSAGLLSLQSGGEKEFHRIRLLTGGNGKELFKAVSTFV